MISITLNTSTVNELFGGLLMHPYLKPQRKGEWLAGMMLKLIKTALKFARIPVCLVTLAPFQPTQTSYVPSFYIPKCLLLRLIIVE